MLIAITHVCDDSCPAPATHRFTKDGLGLEFCDHHSTEHEHVLIAAGFVASVPGEELPAPEPVPEPVP